jgi:redox-sensitive bicupin YhaK (pirin superfamily)
VTIQLQLAAHDKDLGGGFTVRRLLPAARRRSVGPFIFFDHFGPVTVPPGINYDVRPHPHIGLATVTYLFDGAMMHRDSLGNQQLIEPGAINWMTSGRGIVHSERRPDALREQVHVNHGLQLWTALPREHEEDDPSFSHTSSSVIPELLIGDARVRVLVGQAFGAESPVPAFSRTLYLDVALATGGRFELPALAPELAVYAVQGEVSVDNEGVAAHSLAVLEPGMPAVISAAQPARFVVLGGDPLDGPRHMWWNFVSSDKERILRASADWQAQRMGKVRGDEKEFIPLPPTRFAPPEPIS